MLLLAAQEPWAQLPSLAPDALRDQLAFVADDRFEGRRTGEFGGMAMGAYVQSHFTRIGLQPLGERWAHEFPAREQHLDKDNTFLKVGSKRLDSGFDFLPHPTSPDTEVKASMVFVGYGIHAPEYGYSDFEGINLKGRIAVFFRWEPGFADPDSPLLGTRMLPQSTLAAKVRECERRGAVGVITATPPDDTQKPKAPSEPVWPGFSPMYKALSGSAMASMVPAEQLASTNFKPEDMVGQMFTIMQNANPLGAKIGVGYISPRTMRGLMRKAKRDTVEWVAQNAASMEPDSFKLSLKLTMSIRKLPSTLTGRNIVGVLPGSDPKLRDEFIVVGAHYDHVGKNDDGEVWNGADDNGSGTVALLGMAEAFASLPKKERPRRSIVFVAFSGEELGLIGSYHFLVQDLVPVGQIAAMVNTDMIGRSVDHSVYAVGTQSAEGMRGLVEESAAGLDLTVDFSNEEFFDRSDQVGFYYMGVPILFFNTDEHEDYHKPTDTWDLIHYQDMAQIATLSWRTIQRLANLDQRLEFVDAYGRLLPVYGQNAILPIPFPVTWADRLDY